MRNRLRHRRQQRLQLAALALPTDPRLFAFAVTAVSVQEDESCRLARSGGVLAVQRAQGVAGFVEQDLIPGLGLAGRIGPVTEQQELRCVFPTGEVVQVQAMRGGLHRC